jgi:toxin YoeB
MTILWHEQTWDEYQYWIANDPKVQQRLNELLRECRRTPFRGLGKPEPLRGELRGWWSRRITAEDRLVYRVQGAGKDQVLEIIQCRLHY